MATQAYTLYLAKADVADYEELLTEKAIEKIRLREATVSHAPDFGDGGHLVVVRGRQNTPRWLAQARTVFNDAPEVRNQSSAALIIFIKDGRYFSLAYGHGWLYLDETKIIGDFGLRSAINFISANKIKSLERANIAISMRDATQAARDRGLQEFGADDALEIIRKVSGTSDDDEFAGKAVGAKSLKIFVDNDLSEVPELASQSLELFNSEAYKDTPFEIIDFLRPVTDRALINELDQNALDEIIARSGDLQLAVPMFLDQEFTHIKYKGGGGGTDSGVSMEKYIDRLSDKADELTVDRLKQHRILAYGDETEYPIGNWSVYNALIGSIELGGIRYAINEGDWFQVAGQFRDSAYRHYQENLIELDENLGPFIRRNIAQSGKPQIRLETEAAYNERAADGCHYINLDTKLIQIPGTAGPGYEMCDLLDIPGRRFIHVKKGGRNSSNLSHLFRQGANAAQILKSSNEARQQLIQHVVNVADEAVAASFDDASRSLEGWTIEFRIADSPRADGNYDIPFFSKLSFKDEAMRIRTFGMNVLLGFITARDRDPPPAP